jgi:uncharacterized tellurite resistance protein B-like protein
MAMKFLDHFDHPERKQGKEHFIHLVQVAKADGKIDEREMDMLFRIGNKFGLTEPEIKELLKAEKTSDYIPPYELSKRFEQVFDIMKIVCADKRIDENEIAMVKSLAITAGFEESDIALLTTILIDGIKSGDDVDDLFSLYKKKRMAR